MLKERARFLTASIFVLDLGLVTAAFFLAWWLRSYVFPFAFPELVPAPFYPVSIYLPLLPLVLVIWGTLLMTSDCYRSHRTVPLLDEAWDILRVCASGLAILALTLYALRINELVLDNDQFSRLWLLLVGSFSCLFLLAEKIALRTLSRYVRSRGLNYRTVLIVGINPGSLALVDAIRNHRFWGFKVVGFVSNPEVEEDVAVPEPYKVLGTIDDIPNIVENSVIDDVVFCVAHRDLDAMEDLFLCLRELGVRTRFALNLFPHTKAKASFEELDGVPLMTFSTTPERLAPLLFKRSVDVTLSIVMLLLALPIVLGVALIIKITAGGQVLFRQTRCGLNGRKFTLYKFRTMVEGAEQQQENLLHLNEMDGPVFKLSKDPRVTWVGRFLRRFSLDELPQLWNVLRGDMSLVGPRPPIPDEVARYQRWQRRRLSMKPGLTCLWQVSGRNQIDFDRWMQLDLEYIDSWSPWLDMKILLRTVPAVITGRGAS